MPAVSLHYVWINAVPHNNGVVTADCYDPDAVRCPIPERYLENVRKVRRDYPDINITLWIDAYKRNDKKGPVSQAFAQAAGLGDVQFRGLREISAYDKNPLFLLNDSELGKNVTGVIWRQVDLARLLVLEHEMQRVGGLHTYVDLDILEPPVGQEDIAKIARHGFVVEACYDIKDNVIDPEAADYENRLMAFDAGSEAACFFVKTAIAKTLEAYENDIARNPNGWLAFCHAFEVTKNAFLPNVPLKDLTLTRHAQRTDHSDYPGFKV